MRKARIVFLGLLLPIFNLIGCNEELKSSQPATDVRVSQLSNKQVEVSVTGIEQPNAYEILVQWPDAQGTVRLSERSQIVAVVAGSEKKLVIKNVKGGAELAYLVEQLSADGRVSASIPIFLKVPSDIVWDDKFNITDHQKIAADRIFITANAVVTTNDKNLTLLFSPFEVIKNKYSKVFERYFEFLDEQFPVLGNV